MQPLSEFLESIANAIRKRKNCTGMIKAEDFPAEIESIPQAIASELQEKSTTITSNGTTIITPDEGFDGISSATITTNVQPSLQDKSTTLTSTSATSITPDSGYYGLSKVTVTPKLQAKTANCTSTSAVTLTPDSGYSGLSSAKVTPVTETRTHNVTANGSSSISVNSGKVGMTKVTVNTNVPKGPTTSVQICSFQQSYASGGNTSGTFTIPAGYKYGMVVLSFTTQGNWTGSVTASSNCSVGSGSVKYSMTTNYSGTFNVIMQTITYLITVSNTSSAAKVTVNLSGTEGRQATAIGIY